MELTNSIISWSTQRALLGAITPNIRAITVGIKETTFEYVAYFDSEPSEEDKDNMSTVTSEILADFPELNKIEERFVFSDDPISELKKIDLWVYRRKE